MSAGLRLKSRELDKGKRWDPGQGPSPTPLLPPHRGDHVPQRQAQTPNDAGLGSSPNSHGPTQPGPEPQALLSHGVRGPGGVPALEGLFQALPCHVHGLYHRGSHHVFLRALGTKQNGADTAPPNSHPSMSAILVSMLLWFLYPGTLTYS